MATRQHDPPRNRLIVALASGTPDLSTLVSAVGAAELVETLQGEGPFTVFAPTNDAFAALSGSPLTLATFPAPVASRAVAIDVKQSIAAEEPLLRGSYGKTVVFTLSSTTP